MKTMKNQKTSVKPLGIEQTVKKEIKKEFPSDDPFTRRTVEMIGRWVLGGLISRQGRFIVEEISGAAFTYTDNQNMRFTAKVTVSLAPEFDRRIEKTYQWALNGSRYAGKLE